MLAEIREQIGVVAVPEWNRFLNSFSHIFGGGYSAGYYSYLWAEELAADAWGQFRERGVMSAEAGRAPHHTDRRQQKFYDIRPDAKAQACQN